MSTFVVDFKGESRLGCTECKWASRYKPGTAYPGQTIWEGYVVLCRVHAYGAASA